MRENLFSKLSSWFALFAFLMIMPLNAQFTGHTDLQAEALRASTQTMKVSQPTFDGQYGTEGTNTVCADAIPIPSGNFANMDLVCGTTDDLNSDTVGGMCDDDGPMGGEIPTYYGDGHEALYSYTPSATGAVEITVHSTTWAALMVYEGCPIGGSCVAATRSTGDTRTVNFTAIEGVEYFIWVDTWPTPQSPCTLGGQMDFDGPEPMSGSGGEEYCEPMGDTFFDWIDSFEVSGAIENFTNVSGNNGGYGDFYDSFNVTQAQNGTVNFTAVFSDGFDTYGFRIWVDWNQDGIFDPITEVAWHSNSYATSHSGSFTVPADAALGSTRMRIVNDYWSNSADVDPCDDTLDVWGEFEDYKFTVTEGGGEEPGDDYDCEQDYYISGMDPENYDNGLNMTNITSGTSYWIANDVLVDAGVNFKVEALTFDAISMDGDPTGFTLQIYGDDGAGGVGAPLGSPITFGPSDYASSISGSFLGVFDVFRIVFDLSGEDVEFDNTDGTSDATWWIAIQAEETTEDSALFWLVDFHNGNPSGLTWISRDGVWEEYDEDDYEGAMLVEGICTEEGGGSGEGECNEVFTDSAGDPDNFFNTFAGVTFDVSNETSEDMSITGFKVPVTTGGALIDINVWVTTTSQTNVGVQTNPSEWTLVDSFTGLTANDAVAWDVNTFTQIDLTSGFTIPANESRGVYVFVSNYVANTITYHYTNGNFTATDGNLTVLSNGYGSNATEFGNNFADRAFVGEVQYCIGEVGGEEPGDDCEIVCPDDIVVTSPDGEAVVVEYEIEINCDGTDGTPHSVTQNIGDPINNSTGVDCQAAGTASSPGGVMRAYTNDSGADFSISSVEIGGGDYASNTIRINIYTYTGAMGGNELTYDDMTLVGQSALVTPQVGGFMTIDMDTSVVIPAGANYVVEQWRDAGQAFLFGFDDINGETAHTYIYAYGECGITEPSSMASIGFGEYAVIQKVNGLLLDEPELVQTSGLPSGSEFPIGTTTNCFELRDADGNVLAECCFDVTVNTEAEGDECEVDYPTDWTDGLGNLQGLIVANDFEVPADTEMTIEKIIIPIFADITNGTLEFFDDNGGEPGTSIGGPFTVVPDKELVGNVFDFNTYIMEFALPENVVVGSGIYWVTLSTTAGTEGGANYWAEATSTTNQVAMISTDGGVSWETNSFGQDGAFTVEGHCVTLDLGDVSSFDFSYYPNPVRDILYIKSAKNIENVRVFNLVGQEVMNTNKAANGEIRVDRLTTGAYVFRVMLEGGQVETFKIIKK